MRWSSGWRALVLPASVVLTLLLLACGGGLEPGPADADAPSSFTTTDSGLRYRVLRKGSGDTPTADDRVLVHYKGWLDDETVFDSSYRKGKPDHFMLSMVAEGWTEGLQLVSEGGMIELEVPPGLGYGDAGIPGRVPPGATLHFIVELISVE